MESKNEVVYTKPILESLTDGWDKDYMSFFEEHPNFPDDWGFDEAWVFAKHFFKLGLKAQKGE